MKKLGLLVVVLLIGVNVYGSRGYWEDNSNLPETWTTGYVGIGREYPYYQLDVNGTIRMTGFRLTTGASNGYVLTCGSGGVGTWQRRWSKNGNKLYYNSGNIGIGTSQPSRLLDLRKDDMHQIEFDRTANSLITNLFYIGPSQGDGVDHLGIHTNGIGGDNMVVFKSNGRVGIGTTTPFGPLSVKTYDNHNLVVEDFSTGVRIAVCQDNETGNEELVLSGGLGENHVTIHRSGNVGIGTTDPGSYKLAVNGHIRTKEITVESDWSDFVFEDDYQLMSLDKLEEHIKVNRSLPGIPTEKEVKEKGVEVGEMQAKLLEKLEELTLYVIELKKENENLKKRIDVLVSLKR
jgi:hypothetical protein